MRGSWTHLHPAYPRARRTRGSRFERSWGPAAAAPTWSGSTLSRSPSRRRQQLTAGVGEARRAPQPQPRRAEFQRGAQDAEAVLHAAAEIDRRRLGEIARRARQFPDVEPEPDRLRQHLVVEDEIVAVLLQRQRLEQPPREGAIAGVVLG